MADKQISQLVAATTINDEDLFVMQQGGTAKKLSGQKLADFVYQSAADQIERVDEAVEQAEAAVEHLEEQKNEIAQVVASMAELGTDTTLSTPGMAADAAATGVVKDTALARFEQAEITGIPIATFDDGADNVPVKKLIVDIDPVQDLHGYSYPWPGGGGKNKFGVSDATNISNGTNKTLSIENEKLTVTASAAVSSSTIIISTALSQALRQDTLPAGTYIFGIYDLSSSSSAIIASNIKLNLEINGETQEFSHNTAFTLASDAIIKSFTYSSTIQWSAGQTVSFKVDLESGSALTGWVPYSNICPITGWTEANVMRTGKNLLDAVGYSDYWNSGSGGLGTIYEVTQNGDVTVLKNDSRNWVNIPIYNQKLSAGTYTMTWSGNGTLNIRKSDNNYASSIVSTNGVATFTLSTDGYIKFKCGFEASSFPVTGTIQLEKGDSSTSYEPFGTTYPITFPDAAGTVYGGTLDVINGTLTVDKVYIKANSDMTVTLNSSKALSRRFDVSTGLSILNGAASIKDPSNIFNDAWGIMGHSDTTKPYRWTTYSNKIYVTLPVDINTNTLGKQWLIDNEAEFVCRLATPVVYTFSPVEVRTLLALNNIWADTGNINDLIYRKMPIPVKELENTFESMIAGVEETMEATQNYAVDKLVVAVHKLYHIDSNIASGETLVPGTNCHITTIADELTNIMAIVDGYFNALGNLATLNYQVVT